MSIELVTIDFWNTLFDSSNDIARKNHREETVKAEIRLLGIDADDMEIERAGEECWRVFDVIWRNEHRTPTTDEMVHTVLNYLGVEHTPHLIERIAEQYAIGVLHHPPALLPHVQEVIPHLAEHYALAIISDTAFSPGSTLKKLLAHYNIEQYFSYYSFSDETGFSKPHPNAFSIILNAADCKPEQAVHCGDIERTDIIGAKKYGMKAILYKGDKEGKMSLENPETTDADAIAHSWDSVPEIIRTLY